MPSRTRTTLSFLLASVSAIALAQSPSKPGPTPNEAANRASVLKAAVPKEPDTRTTPAPNVPEKIEPAVAPETPDYPLATWVPASPRNFQKGNRPQSEAITMVVIHDIEGSTEGAISWFQNPKARAASHYVVNSTTGKVWQMVKERDIAWHAGSYVLNHNSVGIENEGYAYRPGFYNPVEYEALAKLVRDITTRYNIPRDRQHIISHAEVPDELHPGQFGGSSGHTDPGPYWDWDTLMTLIRNDGALVASSFPATIHPGELKEVTVTYRNTGDDAWTPNNSGRPDEKVTANGAVYLGTWNPQNRTSPFFNYKYWTSPRIASSVAEETAPGATGTFTFSLLGPRALGPAQEDFRLVHYPVAPRTPTAFGDVLSATINVEPWDIVVPAKDGKTDTPGWSFKGDIAWHKAGKDVAYQWTPKLPISGNWDVYARWTPGTSHTKAAMYSISGTEAVPMDQRKGGAWMKLGRFTFNDLDKVAVSLTAPGPSGVLIAGDLRFVGPF